MKMRFLTVLIAALAAASCVPDWAKENDADVLLIMTNVAGQAGGSEESGTTQLFSDVRVPGVINDNAELTLRVIPKTPGVSEAVIETGLNDVILRRYTVHYYRADGRSVPGVDVPHDIVGDMTGTVPVNGDLETSVIVVRQQAKLEPPLRNLAGSRSADGAVRGLGGAQIITAFAEITVYGETAARRTVKATGRLEIVFGEWPDDED